MKGSFPSIERVWVYASPRPFTEAEIQKIHQATKAFLTDWADHGVLLQSDYDLLYDRFIILRGKNPQGRVDGCAIDSSIHFMQQLGAELGINLIDRMTFYYLKDGKAHSVSREDLPKLINTSEIDENTLFFNTLVQTKDDYEQKWLIPFKDHWVKRLLPSSVVLGS